MVPGLLIGQVNGAEPDLISDACDDAPRCVDNTNVPVLHAQGKSTRPDEERRYRAIGAIPNAKGRIDLQTFSVQDQLPCEALCLLIRRQSPILLGEVDLDIRQDLDLVGKKHFTGTGTAIKATVSSTSGYFIPNSSYDSTRTIADLYHATVGVRCKPSWPDYRGGTVSQAKALAVQDQLSDA